MKLQRCLVVSDWHLQGSHTDRYYNQWQQGMFQHSLDRILGYVKEHKPDTVIFAGDIFDSPPKDTELFLFTEFLSKIPKSVTKLLINGNHEVVSGGNSGKSYYWNLVKEQVATQYNLKVLDFEEIDGCLFVGHGKISKLENLAKDYKMIFSHFRSGISSIAADEVDLSLIKPRAKLIILGDIHQRLTYDNVVYAGSPIYTHFSTTNDEEINSPSILFIDTDTLEWEHLDVFEEGQYQKVVLDYPSLELFKEDFDTILARATELNQFFKVRISDTSSNFANFNKLDYAKVCKIELIKSDLTATKQNAEIAKTVQEKLQSHNVSENFTKFVLENNTRKSMENKLSGALATLEARVAVQSKEDE